MTIDVTRVAAGALRGEGGFDPRFGFSRANARFELRAKVLRAELSERMQDYLRVLDGGAGLFGASGHVSRGEWHDYIRALSRKRRAAPSFLLISNEPQPTEYSVGYAAHSWRLRRSGAYVAC